ncbi:choice-of-anchor L domain-containing protein [Microbacterium hibisci]|uniref:choice-of-anchor L domain-containing protein n=1 Tax=Microbacterium hibisci TaxID=2036000 RepID=UPI001940B574|nr:choice-of-anchor L domain-containing protein [Microbacterium hibisci]
MFKKHAFVAIMAVSASLVAVSALPASAATTVQPVSGGITPTQVAEAIAGSGITVSNVALTGGSNQAGLFADPVLTTYGFGAGAVLSSGDVGNLPGPNDAGNTSTIVGTPGDADLSALSGDDTFDAVALSFDFVPDAATVYISYVFGSEEYNEWVGQGFNDVFAFYVNGTNCATVEAGTPVTVDSINGTTNAALFRDNTAAAIDTEMDGLTVVLTCTAAVTPNVPNTMKLVLADSGDEQLDTWVLLRGNGITTTPPEICDDMIDNDGDTLVDGDDPDCVTAPEPGTIAALKYYDANANGSRDAGEPGIGSWPISITDGVTPIDTVTQGDGTVQVDVAAGDYTVSEGLLEGWTHVSPDSVEVTVAEGETTDVSFGNLCLGEGGGHTLGYWQNKNGEASFKATPGALATLVALPLEKAGGATFDPASYSSFRTWLRAANASTPSYMLSAQLAAMALNVASGMTAGTAIVYAPTAASANSFGYTTIAGLMADAAASLTSGTDDLSLSKALDAANNNTTFVQAGPADCPEWEDPGVG